MSKRKRGTLIKVQIFPAHRTAARMYFFSASPLAREGRHDPQFPGFDNFNQLKAKRFPHGDSLGAEPSDDLEAELKNLFERIARRIKIRLIA